MSRSGLTGWQIGSALGLGYWSFFGHSSLGIGHSCPPRHHFTTSHLRRLTAEDITMRVYFLAENAQLQLGGRRCVGERIVHAKLEPSSSLDLFQWDLRVQTQDLHAFGVFMVAENGQIRDHSVRAGAGRQTGGFASPGAAQVARRRKKVEFLDEPSAVVIGDDKNPPTQRRQIVGPTTSRKAYMGTGIVTADHRRIEITIGVDLGPAQKAVIDQTALAGFHHIGHACGHEAAVKGS